MNTTNFLKQKKGVYDLKAVDKKINESIKKVTGNELDNSNKEIINKALLWGSLSIYLADKNFLKMNKKNLKEIWRKSSNKYKKSFKHIKDVSVVEKN